MKMFYFRGSVPNFGDELNPWLLPQIFPKLFDEESSVLFLGIGSVLFDDHPPGPRKIVFGSGYGGYTQPPVFDDKWSFYCVRGPRTARICNLGPDKIAGDSAILIHRFRARERPAGKHVSFMPHWASIGRGHWQAACDIAGLRYIDPTAPVEDVLHAIETSRTVITEAMHGAIVADALRVPWIPALPMHNVHRMKWFDWAEALDIDLKHVRLWPSSTRDAWAAASGHSNAARIASVKGVLKRGIDLLDWGFVRLAAARLAQLAKMPAMQSSDQALDRAINRLEESAERIRRDFPT